VTQKARDEMDNVLLQMFKENQEALPVEDRFSADMCGCKDFGMVCTKVKGHAGDHKSHGKLGSVLHEWPKQELQGVLLERDFM
jgi:hypothetical protein